MAGLREELIQAQVTLGLSQMLPCNAEENRQFDKMRKEKLPLPTDVLQSSDGYYRLKDTDLSEQEVNQLLQCRQVIFLKTIKNCAVFFVVLTVIGLIVSFVLAFR